MPSIVRAFVLVEGQIYRQLPFNKNKRSLKKIVCKLIKNTSLIWGQIPHDGRRLHCYINNIKGGYQRNYCNCTTYSSATADPCYGTGAVHRPYSVGTSPPYAKNGI
jgi:hypothetical protein